MILTGAGISAESGLGTFRDKDGLWTKYPLEQVATPEGYADNPALVHEFYNLRRGNAADAAPNAAHHALAKLQSNGSDAIIVTQNVDGLHEKAGAAAIHMHGELARALCGSCNARWDAPSEMSAETLCPECGAAAARPDIVWFGEIPYHMDKIADHLAESVLFVSIGTSGNVYPAAGFAMEAKRAGARTLELNLEPSETASHFDEARYGPASEIVPIWVEEMLS